MPKGIYIHKRGYKLSESHKRKIASKSIFQKGHPFLGGCPKKGSHVSVKTEFKKGHLVPKKWRDKWSKEHKGVCLNTGRTHFKKGHPKPKNAYSFPVGMVPINNEGSFRNIKRGWYDINGKKMFFRSKWEVNYALYLDFLIKQKQIKKWQYEKDVFIFEKIKFGTRSYRPDFKVFNSDGTIEYHEVKGWFDAKSRTKTKRMRIYYPKIKLVLIDNNYYKELTKKVGRLVGFI